MRNEHTVETHVVSKLGTHLNQWDNPKTLRTMGIDSRGNALFTLQKNAADQGRVVFNPSVINLKVDEFKEMFATLSEHQRNRLRNDYDDKFMSESVYFKNSPSDSTKNMVFSDFMNERTFSQSNVWHGHGTMAVATFVNSEKASAFMEFVERNLPKLVAHFYNELGEVSQKISQVVSLPQSFSAPQVHQVLNNIENKQKDVITSAPSSTPKHSF